MSHARFGFSVMRMLNGRANSARNQLMDSIEDKTRNSSFIENMVEHVFISEMMQEAWLGGSGRKLEVLRSEVDDSGYDIVLCCNRITKYIQLKTSEYEGSTAIQKMNIRLIEKDNACVIWIIRKINKNSRFEFTYRFFGSKMQEPFPDISELKVAKHTKGNATGQKKRAI